MKMRNLVLLAGCATLSAMPVALYAQATPAPDETPAEPATAPMPSTPSEVPPATPAPDSTPQPSTMGEPGTMGRTGTMSQTDSTAPSGTMAGPENTQPGMQQGSTMQPGMQQGTMGEPGMQPGMAASGSTPTAQAVYPPCSRTLQDQCTNTRRESDTRRRTRRPR